MAIEITNPPKIPARLEVPTPEVWVRNQISITPETPDGSPTRIIVDFGLIGRNADNSPVWNPDFSLTMTLQDATREVMAVGAAAQQAAETGDTALAGKLAALVADAQDITEKLPRVLIELAKFKGLIPE